MPNHVDELAQIIWDYHRLNHQLEKADCIIVLGSHDVRVAERGAGVFLAGWAPWLVFSGGFGRLTRDIWQEPEAEKFAAIALTMGVPRPCILIEDKSANAGENILFTRELLKKKEIEPHRIIAVQKPYMERRTYATFRKQWPEAEVIVTSPQLSFAEYPNAEITRDEVIHIMIGDLERIKRYAEHGFQIPQEIPADVWNAYEELVQLGYTKHLLMQNP